MKTLLKTTLFLLVLSTAACTEAPKNITLAANWDSLKYSEHAAGEPVDFNRMGK